MSVRAMEELGRLLPEAFRGRPTQLAPWFQTPGCGKNKFLLIKLTKCAASCFKKLKGGLWVAFLYSKVSREEMTMLALWENGG